MNMIISTGSEPTMIVACVGNKSRVEGKKGLKGAPSVRDRVSKQASK